MSSVLHTFIIGAGQAGLAAGYYLRQAGKDFLIAEANGRVGDNWRKRWQGLELFTPQRYNRLPGLPPDGTDWQLIDRLSAADYLERYATHFSLPIQLRCTCVRAKKTDEHWEVETTTGTYFAQNLIVASGAYKDASIPTKIAQTFSADVRQFHSSAVRDVRDFATENTSVLVVGAGASGQQLSRLCAAAGAEVTLLGPKVANLPRNFLGKDIYWWLYKSGVMSIPTQRKTRPPPDRRKEGHRNRRRAG